MAKVLGSVKCELIDSRFIRYLEDWYFYSTILARWGCIPKEFVCDKESIPWLNSDNPEAGDIHDYFSRYDSDPIVTKEVAAAIYEEFQEYYDKIRTKWYKKLSRFLWRRIKTEAVEVSPGYFHKHSVKATYEELLK